MHDSMITVVQLRNILIGIWLKDVFRVSTDRYIRLIANWFSGIFQCEIMWSLCYIYNDADSQ